MINLPPSLSLYGSLSAIVFASFLFSLLSPRRSPFFLSLSVFACAVLLYIYIYIYIYPVVRDSWLTVPSLVQLKREEQEDESCSRPTARPDVFNYQVPVTTLRYCIRISIQYPCCFEFPQGIESIEELIRFVAEDWKSCWWRLKEKKTHARVRERNREIMGK